MRRAASAFSLRPGMETSMYESLLTDFDIQRIMDSGQVFRIRPLTAADGRDGFLAAAGNRAVLIRQRPEPEGRMRVWFSCTEEEFEDFWKDYFDLDRDYGSIRRSVDPKDSFLSDAVRFGYGIRILRQDLWETIVSFLISQNNNITRIRRSIEALCARYGEPILPDGLAGLSEASALFDTSSLFTASGRSDTSGRSGASGRSDASGCSDVSGLFAFPTPEAIAGGGETGLEGLGLGYRDKYIFRMALRCAGPEGRSWLERLRESSREEAMELLLREFGIGKKVADCICLFALHYVDAFPVDTHMKQILAACYPEGFPFGRYEGYAGILQQYLFYYKLRCPQLIPSQAGASARK